MRRQGFAGAFWPTPLQESLLRAAVMPADDARASWARLRPDLNLDDIWDPEVHRLLPLVHQSLATLGVDDPDLPRLRGLARRTWYENQLRLRGMAPVIARLEAAGIPTLLLKGLPMALRYYKNLALRPMLDVDVLIPTTQRDDALDLMAAHGWRMRRRHLSLYHGEELSHPDGRKLDLHWHLGMPFMLRDSVDESEDDFWSAAIPVDATGVATRTLCPADMLLHICVHGAWSGSGSTVRWIADAMTVIREEGERIDWERFVDQVARRRLMLLVGEPLRYLVQVFGALIPGEVLTRVTGMTATRRERRRYARMTLDLDSPALTGRLPLTMAQWAYASGKWSRLKATWGFPLFLQDQWALDSLAKVPPEAGRKVIRRLREGRQPHPIRPEPG
jgi:Uncharacterised nucleotidyltransferase